VFDFLGLGHHAQQSAPSPAPPQQEQAPPAPQQHGGGGLLGGLEHLASQGLGAVEGAAGRLTNGVNESRGPALNSFWNHLFGGPNQQAGDGRPLTQNHIGTQKPSKLQEGGTLSNLMRDTPYFGDYWEALSVTHDSAKVHPSLLDGITAVTNVGIPGPLMGLVDAPFRATGHSLFLDQQSLNK
jgi:hypothetical protein